MKITLSDVFAKITFVEDKNAKGPKSGNIKMSDVYHDVEIHLAPGIYDLEMSDIYGVVEFKGNNISFDEVDLEDIFGRIAPIPYASEEEVKNRTKTVTSSFSKTEKETGKTGIIDGERYS